MQSCRYQARQSQIAVFIILGRLDTDNYPSLGHLWLEPQWFYGMDLPVFFMHTILKWQKI